MPLKPEPEQADGDGMTSPPLTLADPPKHAGLHAFTCARCTFEELRRPVFLSDGNAYGTRCAAIMLGLVPETATTASASRALKAAQADRAEQDRRDRAAAGAVAQAPWFEFLEAYAPGYGTTSERVTALGGFAAAKRQFEATR